LFCRFSQYKKVIDVIHVNAGVFVAITIITAALKLVNDAMSKLFSGIFSEAARRRHFISKSVL